MKVLFCKQNRTELNLKEAYGLRMLVLIIPNNNWVALENQNLNICY